MTLEEINARETELRQEIADREQLLAAYQLIRGEHEKSLPRSPDIVPVDQPAPEPLPEETASRLEPTPSLPGPPETNLEALGQGYGGGVRLITWAIRQMTGDFGARHIAAALRQAGCPMRVGKISVVLNRMKSEGKIAEITTGRGRAPSSFRATERITTGPLEFAARHRAGRPVPYYISP